LRDSDVKLLKEQVACAKRCDSKVILDVHNYGAYWLGGAARKKFGIGASDVTTAHFADLWSKLSEIFASDPTVEAYGLMNEPIDVVDDWHAISKSTVQAIRARKDDKLILIGGKKYSSAHTWAIDNGERTWIDDGNVVYEAHCYFDASNSGEYKQSFEQEYGFDQRIAFRGPDRLAPFVKWCRANGARGFIGEFGVPHNDERWLTVLDRFLEALDREGIASCYWAAGEWWGDYPLSIQPQMDFRKSVPPFDHLIRQ